MISKEELEKLTVTQLKEKLKSRKLLLSGTKSDLVARLYESFLAEEKLLGNIDTENESAGPSEFDLANVDLDEVLGTDNELLSPNLDHKKVELDSTFNSLVNTTKLDIPLKNTAPFPKNNEKNLLTISANSPTKAMDFFDKPNNELQNNTHTSSLISSSKLTESLNNNDKSTFSIADSKTGLSSEDGHKMLQISKRLGLPCKNSSSVTDSQDVFTKRAQRFGSASVDENKKLLRLTRFGLSESSAVNDDKISKRAQRFGIVSSDENEKKKLRLGRFGLKSTVSLDEEEKLKRRADRFGNLASKV